MTDTEGRTAFITGGANGIGLGMARALAAAGAKLALADLDAEALRRAEGELSAYTKVWTVVLDVRDREGFARAADEAEQALGPVSLLFNNAGVFGGGPAHSLSYATWDWGMGVNVGGVINGLQVFLPRMVERGGGGHIVNTASSAGLAASATGVLYHTSKFAVVGLSETLRLELAPLGIGVTVLCPGPVATALIDNTRKLRPPSSAPRNRALEQKGSTTERSRQMSTLLAQGASPDEVGRLVLGAVRDNRLYVHTDRSAVADIQARSQALLDAMPAV